MLIVTKHLLTDRRIDAVIHLQSRTHIVLTIGTSAVCVSFAGFSDVGKSWQMTDYEETDIESMVLRLYEQMKPFYQQLHAYVRRRLIEAYPNHGLDPSGPIPAHLLGMFRHIPLLSGSA